MDARIWRQGVENGVTYSKMWMKRRRELLKPDQSKSKFGTKNGWSSLRLTNDDWLREGRTKNCISVIACPPTGYFEHCSTFSQKNEKIMFYRLSVYFYHFVSQVDVMSKRKCWQNLICFFISLKSTQLSILFGLKRNFKLFLSCLGFYEMEFLIFFVFFLFLLVPRAFLAQVGITKWNVTYELGKIQLNLFYICKYKLLDQKYKHLKHFFVTKTSLNLNTFYC